MAGTLFGYPESRQGDEVAMRTLRMLLPVVPSVLIVPVLMMVTRQLFPSEIMHKDIDVWGAYFG